MEHVNVERPADVGDDGFSSQVLIGVPELVEFQYAVVVPGRNKYSEKTNLSQQNLTYQVGFSGGTYFEIH